MTLRLATAADSRALARLAALDSAPRPAGRVLVALIEGRALAAISLDTGRVVADPFAPTAELEDLLRARAAHLDAPKASAEPRCGAAARGSRPLGNDGALRGSTC